MSEKQKVEIVSVNSNNNKTKQVIIKNPDIKILQKNSQIIKSVNSRKNLFNKDILKKTTNFLITGGSGLLASHIIYQIIEDNIDNIDNIRIFNLIHNNSKEKFDYFLRKKLLYKKSKKIPKEKLRKFFFNIDFDLKTNFCGLDEKLIEHLQGIKIDHFFHIAALTDFRNSTQIKKRLNETNLNGTKRILELARILKIKKIHYISSSYVCGKNDGLISPYYINTGEFHNYYEKSKLNAELYFEQYCKNNKLQYMIYRIATISGRLINEPIGYTNKYDVFYSWFHFFYKIKQKTGLLPNDKLILKIRLHVAKNQGLNIVPVDYAAKIISDIARNDLFHKKENKVHIANNNNFNHREYINLMLDTLNISGYKFVDNLPPQDSLNNIEKIYYKYIGSIFHGYLNEGNMIFDVSNIKNYFSEIIQVCPEMNAKNYFNLLKYALKTDFNKLK